MKKENLEKQAVSTIDSSISKDPTRFKTNFRVGLTSKTAIISEARKSISAAYRFAIRSLLMNTLSDANVDLLTVTFIRRALKDDGVNFDSIPEKFTIVRNGDFIQCSIDNYLSSDIKLSYTSTVLVSILLTDVDTFDKSTQNIKIPLPFIHDEHTCPQPFVVLDVIFNELVNSL